ncbi:M20/M25/M40 family metallo-hydrolase [Crassaminicella thermophila]|uniref:M20/M25/M40 family metallo-hydrolase n=1 Tax=Crassaminicella thermophila TaxID=2599308 RepID=A0A5C0SH60_CRATE|nr:M20/M25/M40 family metallo-hydrolase [Crassaminicella thermophila]QEK13322.1 M20/M25/M40 family metallo-hydrolase [Crassaminicella thermophila]
MINQERVVNEFLKYVQIDSPTKSEGKFAKFIAEELKNIGLEVHIDDAGEKVGSDTGNVIAKLKGTKDSEPVLFSCHMDTVSPGVGIKPVIKDGVIYSDGTTVLGGDNKAGIAAVLEALKALKENNIEHGLIEVVFSIYEEGGLFGAKNLDYKKIESKRAFVLDSGGDPGQIIVKGPAQDKINAKIIGKPAHAGVCPEEGISAIQVAAKAISNMNLLRIDEETTANIGVIQGGKVTNIVCPEVEIKAEARSLNNEKLDRQTSHMVECLKKAAEEFGAEVEIHTERMYSAFMIDENDEIVNTVRKACENIGLKPFTQASGGGSDTNILNENGIKAVNLGIGEKKPHTLEEHLKIEDLVNSAKLVLEIIKTV